MGGGYSCLWWDARRMEAAMVKGADKIQVPQISKSPDLEVLGVADGYSHLRAGSLDEVCLVLRNVRKAQAV
jgi:hypothetical protein